MPIGSAVHARTFPLCESLNYREWSGFYAVSSYEAHHEHEYNAIRNASALIDVSPLYKYRLSGRDAVKLVDRVITRDGFALAVGQVYYTPWCDEHGKVIDDGTVTRLSEDSFRWTAADPSLRWFTQNAIGLDVVDRGHLRTGGGAGAAGTDLGPPAGRRRRRGHPRPEVLPHDPRHHRRRAGRDLAHRLYRRSRLRDLDAVGRARSTVWDALMAGGRPFDIHAAGMLALDVARVEAGLLLIEVDFFSSKKALIESQKYSPFEMGLGRLVRLDTRPFVGRAALVEEQRRGISQQIVGLDISWPAIEALYDKLGLAPQIAAAASRVAVPVYRGGRQVGRATTTTWSPVLKKLIALATVAAPHHTEGAALEIEVTVEAVRHRVPATVVKTPFFNPARKTASIA